MSSEILVDIQEEVTCPICLDLMTEPMSLDCGHSFCKACIPGNSKESETSEEEKSSCPVCRTSYQPGNLRPNRHLANIVERLREVQLGPGKQPKLNVCVQHGEKLQLFCKNDWKVICWLCERSQEHRGHQTFLVEEAALECQEKLQLLLQQLRKDQQEAEKLEADVREEKALWKNRIQNDRQHIQSEFTQLRGILDSEELKELQNLKTEEGKVLNELAEAENEMVKQSQFVKKLISDVEHRLQGSRMEMLQDVHGIMERSEGLTLKKPITFQNKQRSVFRAPDLSEMLQASRVLRNVQCCWVPMTLNPINPNSGIVVSEDGTQARYNPELMKNSFVYGNMMEHPFSFGKKMHSPFLFGGMMENPCSFGNMMENSFPYAGYDDGGILGSHVITSGTHYWEVDVSHKTAWLLGVSCGRHTKSFPNTCFKQSADYQGCYFRYQPQNGYWVIGLSEQNGYNVFQDSVLPNHSILALSLTVSPRRVGVFIDCTAKTVSFFNVTNCGCLIYTFSNCHFSQSVYPYFNTRNCTGPMSLCPPNS